MSDNDKGTDNPHYYYDNVGKPLRKMAFGLLIVTVVTVAGLVWLVFTAHQ